MPSIWSPGASSPLNKFTTPTFRFNGLLGGEPWRNDRVPDPNNPDKLMDSVSPIAFGTGALLDFFSLHHGFAKFTNGAENRKYMRPVTEPYPSQPSDPDYKEGFKLLVGVRGFGVMEWTCLQELAQEEMFDRWLMFARSSEARMGQIPAYRIGQEEVHSKARKSTFFKIAFEFIAYGPRNPALFGPVLIDLSKAAATATLEIPDDRPTRPETIDQTHQERLSQSQPTPAKSRDPRYNVTHAAEAPVNTNESTMSDAPKPGFSTLLDDEIPW